MPSERLSMRKIRDTLRSNFDGGLSERRDRALAVSQHPQSFLTPRLEIGPGYSLRGAGFMARVHGY
jgi:hypothetical protein